MTRQLATENEAALAAAIAERRATADAYPAVLDIALESSCNASCLFCGSHHPGRRLPQRRLSGEAWDALREEVIPHVSLLSWASHHEPLLSPRFVELLRGEEGIPSLRFLSNGLVLPKYVDQLISYPHGLIIGISANAASGRTHALLTGSSPDRLDAIFEGIRSLAAGRRANGCPLHIETSFVVVGANVHELGAFVQRSLEAGVDAVRVRSLWWGLGTQYRAERGGYVFDYERESTWRHKSAMDAQLARARRFMEERGFSEDKLDVEPVDVPGSLPLHAKRVGERLGLFALARTLPRGGSFEWADCAPAFRWLEPALIRAGAWRMTDRVCVRPWRRAFVDERGNVRCCTAHLYYLGRLGNGTFLDIWNGWRARLLRSLISQGRIPFPCSGCSGCEHP